MEPVYKRVLGAEDCLFRVCVISVWCFNKKLSHPKHKKMLLRSQVWYHPPIQLVLKVNIHLLGCLAINFTVQSWVFLLAAGNNETQYRVVQKVKKNFGIVEKPKIVFTK